MNFCCSNFEGSYFIGNNFGINIRIVMFSSDFLVNQNNHTIIDRDTVNNAKDKRKNIRFFMTMGYEKFNLDLAMANIDFCPFCGTNLHDFYNKDEYANEIENKTFIL